MPLHKYLSHVVKHLIICLDAQMSVLMSLHMAHVATPLNLTTMRSSLFLILPMCSWMRCSAPLPLGISVPFTCRHNKHAEYHASPNIHAACMHHACTIHASIHAPHMQHACNIYAMYMQHACTMHAADIQSSASTIQPAICIHPTAPSIHATGNGSASCCNTYTAGNTHACSGTTAICQPD